MVVELDLTSRPVTWMTFDADFFRAVAPTPLSPNEERVLARAAAVDPSSFLVVAEDTVRGQTCTLMFEVYYDHENDGGTRASA